MINYPILVQTMKSTGKTMTFIAKESGIERTTLYNRLKGIGDFTASEILGLTKSLNLSREERDAIFFN